MVRQPEIYNLLYRLGLTANYTGFFYLSCAVGLCLERPDRLLLVTKWLYPEIARQYQTNWKSVERNIRTVGGLIWCRNKALLEGLAGRPLLQRPRNTQLLAILTYSLSAHPPDALAASSLPSPPVSCS